MYAAAGGASLASRQARQRQRQNKQKQQQKNQKASVDLVPKPPQAKQFHNYTDPAGVGLPKLSRVERGTLKPPSTVGAHERRHSTSNYHLKESGSCHLSGRGRIRESPSISIPVVPQHLHHHHHHQPLTPCTLVQENSSSTPQHHHHTQHHPSQSHPPNYIQSPSSADTSTTYHPNQQYQQLPQIFIPEGEEGKPERRCSFVRQVEEMEKCQEGDLLDRCNHLCNFEINKQWDNNISFYTDYEKDVFGSLDYPFSECSQGRAAWQERERGRRCSISEEARQHRIKQTEAHHRWMKRNRIHDASYGGGSEEDFFSVYHQSAAANALLYVGLGTTAIGSVIFFVGTGEKGFKTLELRLIGPTLIACGLLCCLIRVLLCACPSNCFKRRKKMRLKSSNPCAHNSSRYPLAPRYHHHNPHHSSGEGGAEDHQDHMMESANLLSKHQQYQQHIMQKKKVSIVPPHAAPNYSLPSTSTSEFKEFPLSLPQEKSTALTQIAKDDQSSHDNVPIHQLTTTEEKIDIERIEFLVPQINLPRDSISNSDNNLGLSNHQREDSIIELQTLDMQYDDVVSVSSYESDDTSHHHNLQQRQGDIKFNKNREPVLSTATSAPEPITNLRINKSINENNDSDIETCLSVVIEPNDIMDDRNDNKNQCKDDNASKKAVTTASSINNSCNDDGDNRDNRNKTVSDNNRHSGIVLSPLQLGQ